MAMYVCSGAMLKCTFGVAPSVLNILHPPGLVNLEKKPMANMMDFKPMVNVMPFGMCNSLANPTVASATAAAFGVLTPMPCVPNIVAPWLNFKVDVFVKKQPAITDMSKLMCLWAGVIEVTNAGQMTKICKGK